MELGYTTEQQAMRTELRDYYAQLLDDQTRADLADAHGVGGGLAHPVRRQRSQRHRAVHLL
jgi:hypothetical protein